MFSIMRNPQMGILTSMMRTKVWSVLAYRNAIALIMQLRCHRISCRELIHRCQTSNFLYPFDLLRTGDNMTVDFHFQTANIVKYRTDVTFGWLDLMVSFGGIAGLFLGCSILSGVEIVYYFSIVLLIILKKIFNYFELFINSRSAKINVIDEPAKNKKFRKAVENVRVINVQSLNEMDNNIIKPSYKKRY